jgi:malate dehydrogenase
MTRLDHNRAISQLAAKTGAENADVKRMTIWGNHSVTQVPDLTHATVGGRPALDLVDAAWVVDEFIPTVQKRGATVIAARGASSAASAAAAAIDQMRDWSLGTPEGDWVSMAIPSRALRRGPGLMYSFPVTVRGGVRVVVVPDLAIADVRAWMAASEQELIEERDAVAHLLG